MPIQTTQTLANVLARGIGLDIRKQESIEEAEERRREFDRSLAGIERGRKAERRTGLGRLFGGGTAAGLTTLALPSILAALGAPATGGLSLLIPALAAGAGSFVGQKVATRDVAKEKLTPIGVGAFQVGRGREREAQFRLGERAFGEDLSSAILGNVIQDAMSAVAFQKLLPGFGGFGKKGVSFGVDQALPLGNLPGPFLPRSLMRLSDIDRRGIISILRSLGRQ